MNRNSAPAYILSIPSGHYFRIAVPPDLVPIVGKREIRYSLRTGFLSTAKYRARRMAGFVQPLFQQIRNGGNMRQLTDREIKSLLDQYVKTVLEDDEMGRLMEDGPIKEQVHQETLEGYVCLQEAMKLDLVDCNHGNASKIVNRLLEANDFEADPVSYPFRKLCREMLKVQSKILEVLTKREQGDYPMK